MKRFLVIAGPALLLGVALAMGSYDSHATVVKSVSYADVLKAAMPALHVDYAAPAQEFAPAFTSNFCGLVVFPELGSESLCDGYSAIARGPPKSHKS